MINSILPRRPESVSVWPVCAHPSRWRQLEWFSSAPHHLPHLRLVTHHTCSSSLISCLLKDCTWQQKLSDCFSCLPGSCMDYAVACHFFCVWFLGPSLTTHRLFYLPAVEKFLRFFSLFLFVSAFCLYFLTMFLFSFSSLLVNAFCYPYLSPLKPSFDCSRCLHLGHQSLSRQKAFAVACLQTNYNANFVWSCCTL